MSVLTNSNNINFEVCRRVLSQSVYALLSLIQAMLDQYVHLNHKLAYQGIISRFENWSMAVSTKSWLIIVQQSCMIVPGTAAVKPPSRNQSLS